MFHLRKRKIHYKGYIKIYDPKHLEADKNGYVLEHRKIMDKELNKKGRNNVVHHIDGNKSNNKKNNLLILTRKEHYILHQKLNKKRGIKK